MSLLIWLYMGRFLRRTLSADGAASNSACGGPPRRPDVTGDNTTFGHASERVGEAGEELTPTVPICADGGPLRSVPQGRCVATPSRPPSTLPRAKSGAC